MTTPPGDGVRVPASGEFTALAGQLDASGEALWGSLQLDSDSPLWQSPDLYKDYFGPAREIADEYVGLTHRFRDLVSGSVAALHRGSDAFTESARLFADAERENEERLRRGPR